jgi:GntR family transcriptional regulator, transcriptional repressor for pyruvate dehydrogenase complex
MTQYGQGEDADVDQPQPLTGGQAARRGQDTVAHRSSDMPELTPLDTRSASDGVAGALRGLIFSGELSPGDRLPPSRDLAQQLGVSSLTLRLGLKALETTGYLVTTRGARGGTRVNDIVTLSRIWVEWMDAKGDEVRDMWEFREIVEGSVARLAAERRSETDLAAVEAALRAGAADSHTAILRWNGTFHDALAEAAHSSHLERAVIAVRKELFLPVELLLREHSAEELRASHAEICAGVRERDPARAQEAMLAHIESTRAMVTQALAELRAPRGRGS